MGRHVKHSVAGHDAVFARATGPIVLGVLAAGEADPGLFTRRVVD